MASSNDKPQETVPSSSPTSSANETSRARSIATRLTEAEFGEVEAAAANAGKKVAEWLREAALAHARAGQEEQTDLILLAEIMAMRSLMLNLFAKASQGPLSTEDLRKMSAYSDSIKEQKAKELHCPKASPEQSQNPGQGVMKLSRIRAAFPWRIAIDPGPGSVSSSTRVLGMV